MKFIATIRDTNGTYYSVFHTCCEGRHLYHCRTNSNLCVSRISYQEGDFSVSSWVAVKHRRRGIATAMYDLIEEDRNIELLPSRHLTTEGNYFWVNRNNS